MGGLPPRSAAERHAGPSTIGDSELAGPLAVYFRESTRAGVMSREEEGLLATRINELRRSLWRAALSYPPFIAGICDLAREVLPVQGCPSAALDAMILTARKLRDRDLIIHREQYEADRQALANALAEADLDNLVAERMLADLASIEAGEHHGLSMHVKLPPRGSLLKLKAAEVARLGGESA